MEKILIMGIGLIGGSIARDLGSVYALDKNKENLDKAKGYVIKGYQHLDEVDITPDAVIICVPVNVAISMAPQLIARFPNAIFVDCCSTKRAIEAAYSKVSYAGMHPMAGSEGSGFENSRKGLFKGATMCVSGQGRARDLARELAIRLGGRVVELNGADHDRAVATVSHLPHIIASSLCAAADEKREQIPQINELAAGGFADITRIADSDSAMWSAIYQDNADMLLESLQGFEQELKKWEELLKKGDLSKLKQHFEKCKESKQHFKRRQGIYPKDGVRFLVPCKQDQIPDIALIAMRNGAVSVGRSEDGASVVCSCSEDAHKLKMILSAEDKWKNTVL